MISEVINIFALNTKEVFNIDMNKKDLIKEISLSTGVDQETTRKVFNSIIEIIQKQLLYGVNVKIKGFMSLVLNIKKESKKFHLIKREMITVPKHYTVKIILPRKFIEKIAKKTVY